MKRIRLGRSWAKLLVGVVLGVLAAGAVVQAQTTDGTIHGCVDLNSHNLQVDSAPNIQSHGGCINGVSVELVWRNADTSGQGPQGPPGPQGPAGPQGPRGESGAGAAGALRTIHRTIGPSVNATKQGAARCDDGQHVVSGGYSLSGDAKGVQVKASRPSGTSAWFARAQQTRAGSADWSLLVYAICAT
jgi:hypothetical protein